MSSVIVHYQEIALKGRNRPWFVERLVSNLRVATANLGVARVRPLNGRVELTLDPDADWGRGEATDIENVRGSQLLARSTNRAHD